MIGFVLYKMTLSTIMLLINISGSLKEEKSKCDSGLEFMYILFNQDLLAGKRNNRIVSGLYRLWAIHNTDKSFTQSIKSL